MPKSKPNRRRARKFLKKSGSKGFGCNRPKGQGVYPEAVARIMQATMSRQCPEWSKFKRMGSSARDFSAEINDNRNIHDANG